MMVPPCSSLTLATPSLTSAVTTTSNPRISAVSAPQKKRPPIIHTTPLHSTEVAKSLQLYVKDHMLHYLKPVEDSWQPHDFLPDTSKPLEEVTEEVRALRERAAHLSDDYFVVLAGDMITEEALPTYQSWISVTNEYEPESAADPSPWATWVRGWTAEENRHGDVLRMYMYLSGRVDMAMIDRTIHHLIGSGMDIGTERHPYLNTIYGAFQERATAISHGNTARLAKRQGDTVLAHICGTIAADEKRHEKAYTALVAKFLEIDPDGVMQGIAYMMRQKIKMPSHLMYDGRDPNIYHHFEDAAQRMGVYTGRDYADILEHLVAEWRLEKVEGGLTGEGRAAQEFLCTLAPKIRRLQEKAEEIAKKRKPRPVKLSWIFNKELIL